MLFLLGPCHCRITPGGFRRLHEGDFVDGRCDEAFVSAAIVEYSGATGFPIQLVGFVGFELSATGADVQIQPGEFRLFSFYFFLLY